MTPLFKKLNFKNQAAIVVLNAPDSFAPEMKAMEAVVPVTTSMGKAKTLDFAIVFATKQAEVDKAAAAIAPKLVSDGIVWFCYPKGSSKKYKCDFNRDTGWHGLGQLGFEPVRQVAIDEDWSALRFRRAEHIKTMTRSFAMTDTGKQKVAAGKNKK